MTVLALVLSAAFAHAQNTAIKKDKWYWYNPMKQDTANGYVQVVRVDNVPCISWVAALEVTPVRITRVCRALQRLHNSFGATFQNVVKENLQTTDMDAMQKYDAARKAFYKGDFPAATWTQISRLCMPEAKLEVELVAHLSP
jgi:enamine deaminase RidA (YjgF/YER057c/UK114 family)